MNEITLTCDGCGAVWHINEDEDPVIVKPFPHIQCPDCGFMIPLF